MAEGIADLTRRLHEALDVIERRDALVERLRADLETAGRRLSEEASRRRSAEHRVDELEGRLAAGPPDPRAELGGRAAAGALVRHAGHDLGGAAAIALGAVWHRVPEPYRARAQGVRARVRRGRPA
jgi:hypothetical protein